MSLKPYHINIFATLMLKGWLFFSDVVWKILECYSVFCAVSKMNLQLYAKCDVKRNASDG